MEGSDDSDNPCIPALVVDYDGGEDMDQSIPPTSGNEYLRRVRLEAQDCPRVVVANMDTSSFLTQQTVKCSEPGGLLQVPMAYRAPLQWQKMQVSEFAVVRQKLTQFKALVSQKKIKVPSPKLPDAKDADTWCRLCFGKLKLKSGDSSDKEQDNSDLGTPPMMHIVAQMSQLQITNVLEYHTNWLEATGFSTQQGRWFYALLANLQKPLDPEVCSWLRRLSRLCSNIRASLDNENDPMLKELNLLICLVSRYFDQRDLADS